MDIADILADALHTLDLPLGNRTPDETLIEQAALEARVLVAKDDDFVELGRDRLTVRPWSRHRVGTGRRGGAKDTT